MSTTTASVYDTAVSSNACFFDPLTCKRQSFSIPEKIVYYIAKNVKNAETFKKLVETCKYFFKINPVVVVHRLECHRHEWDAGYDEDGKYNVGFKYDQLINFKIWVTDEFSNISGDASQLISSIYKNDAINVNLGSEPLKFEEFLFFAGNAENLAMWKQLVKYANGKTLQFEEIVQNLPKLKSLDYQSCFEGSDVNSNTARKLMEIDHFRQLSDLEFYNVSEDLDVEVMFKYICANKHIEVNLWYRHGISDVFKELVRKYSNLLRKANVCNSRIGFIGMGYDTFDDHEIAVSEVDSSSVDGENLISFVYENDDLMFPWKNEENEEWELPWDKID